MKAYNKKLEECNGKECSVFTERVRLDGVISGGDETGILLDGLWVNLDKVISFGLTDANNQRLDESRWAR